MYKHLMVTTNQKPTTIDTQKRERIPNITLKKIIKPQEKKLKEEERTEQNCIGVQRSESLVHALVMRNKIGRAHV